MTSPLASEAAPFGRLLTAMVTPFTPDGELDTEAAPPGLTPREA